MQLAPKSAALRTPCQEAAGFGARQRRSPTGGAANGTPRKMVTDGSVAGTPESNPVLVRTGSFSAAARGSARARRRANRNCMPAIIAPDDLAGGTARGLQGV